MTAPASSPFSPSPPLPSVHSSLLTATDSRGHVHLILGTNPLAGARAAQCLAAGASPILIAPDAQPLHYGLQKHVDSGALPWLRRDFDDADLTTLGRAAVDRVVDAVFVTVLPAAGPLAASVAARCRRLRVPVNVADSPALSTFSLLSTHTDGPLQVGVTTNGRGCKLAGRIRREIAALLPPGLGDACARLGDARRGIQEEDRAAGAAATATGTAAAGAAEVGEKEGEETAACARVRCGSRDAAGDSDADGGVDDSVDQTAAFNRLVAGSEEEAAKNRRMRWLSQVCEYWPLKRLAAITDADVASLLEAYRGRDRDRPPTAPPAPPQVGRIILAGSGPGHPDLLTRATHKAIQAADLVLADKLVPAGVLELVPRRTPVRIARKFPGNAERAQEELLEQALEGVRAGRLVLRLKQGDPFVYGRGGEEVDFFRRAGLGDRVVVLPGVTSALSAPLFAGVPPTQRDVADQVLVCTGTGKRGKAPAPPEFVPSRTVVFLMALHRIAGLVEELTMAHAGAGEAAGLPPRRLWPSDTPCAVIERASCPDQRVMRTTLRFVAEAVEQEGSRPPGLLVVGRACEALYTPEKGRSWIVEDGFKGLDLDHVLGSGAGGLAFAESSLPDTEPGSSCGQGSCKQG